MLFRFSCFLFLALVFVLFLLAKWKELSYFFIQFIFMYRIDVTFFNLTICSKWEKQIWNLSFLFLKHFFSFFFVSFQSVYVRMLVVNTNDKHNNHKQEKVKKKKLFFWRFIWVMLNLSIFKLKQTFNNIYLSFDWNKISRSIVNSDFSRSLQIYWRLKNYISK
jgi:hypothetical protein